MKKSSIGQFLFCLVGLFAFAGCGSHVTEYRKMGFDFIQQGFASIENTPELYEVIELEKVRIYIVGDRKHFKWENAEAYGSPIAGYANTNNEIGVFGKRVGNKIIVNQAILGHELNHLLNFKNHTIADPDKLDNLGL